MLGMDAARKAFETAAVRVSGELEKLQERVNEANAKLSVERARTEQAVVKRRRCSGKGTGAQGACGEAEANTDAQTEQRFDDTVSDAEERLQTATRAMARVHAATQSVRASVDAAKADATALLSAERLASAKESRNEGCNELVRLMGRVDLGSSNHAMVLRHLGVVSLWRVRGVCRGFRRWATSMLSSLPRVVAVGGKVKDSSAAPRKNVPTASVESLDLSTMRWSAAGCMPSLPDPRAWHSVSCRADGRAVVCGGRNYGGADLMDHLRSTALQWLPGTGGWSALPDLPAKRLGAASVELPDGRTMLIGGSSGHQVLASVLVLAADGSRWSDLPPLTEARADAAAALLPDGKVLVAGGMSGLADAGTALNTAELWDPATQKWTALPPMAHKRAYSAACMLPSGRVAVVGGAGTDSKARKDGEVFDPVKREWEPLGAEMAHKHGNIGAVAVAGGLLAVGVNPPELYDEESGRWVTLPHAMVEPGRKSGLISVPAAALVAVAAAGVPH
eukprot:COSAG06_NODE_985_length_11197_cov_12.342314_2_plen_506_part_00